MVDRTVFLQVHYVEMDRVQDSQCHVGSGDV